MPPEKKRKVNVTVQPAIALQYLAEHFKDYGGGDIKNGHILYFYLENEKSVKKTIDTLRSVSGMSCAPSKIVTLVKNSIEHYKHLTNETEMEKFRNICDNIFLGISITAEISPSPPVEEPSTPLVDEPSPIVKEDDNDRPTPYKDSEEVLVLQESDSPVIKSTPLPLSPQPGPSSTVSLRSDQMTPRKAKMKQETESARLHNIDAEELMGMFSAAQRRGPSATLCFLSCRMRAIKNRTVKYLHSLDEEKRDKILKKAVSYGRQQRMKRRKRQKYLSDELIKRQDEKKQARHSAKRRELERNMKYGLESVLKDFTVNEETKEQIQDILDGRAVGRNIAHVWNEDGNIVSYNGRIEKLKKASCKYRVSYWNHDGAYEDAEDYDMSIFALAVDLLFGDLILSD